MISAYHSDIKHLSELFGLNTSKPLYTIKACPLLPYVEAVRLPIKLISDVHAISANNHNYRLFDTFRNFSRFYILLITAIVVVCFTLKSHSARLALKPSWAKLVAKIQIIFESPRWISKKMWKIFVDRSKRDTLLVIERSRIAQREMAYLCRRDGMLLWEK